MKASLTVLLLLLTLSAASPCQMKPEQAATEAAKGWLALTDGGDYAASWETAAPVFKNGVTKVGWAQMFKSARAPLGKVIFRNVKSAVYTTSMPGAPDGRYVVIRCESSFEHKSSAIETVTPSLGDDGQWRVSGYYIR